MLYPVLMGHDKLDHLDQYLERFADILLEWLNYRIWLIEDWWHAGKYGPPTLWYNLQTFLDPPPPPGSAGPDIDIVAFAMKYMTKKQIHREAWYHYHKTKWIVRPESMIYALNRMKTKKDKKYMHMLLELEKLVLDNYKALLAEVEIRRVHTDEELTQANSHPVVKAQIRQTYDAYFDSLEFTTHPEINLQLNLPEKESRSSQLERQVQQHFLRYPKLTNSEKIEYVLHKVGDSDYCIFKFGVNVMDYLQFTRRGGDLVLNFPYSIKYGQRHLQVDRVGLILKCHGFGPTLALWPQFIKQEIFMLLQDSCSESGFVQLEAYFGHNHEHFGTEVTMEIAKKIFRFDDTTTVDIAIGSWKE